MSHGVTGSSTDKPKDVEKVEQSIQDAGESFSGQGLGFSQGGLGFAPAAGQQGDGEPEMEIADLPTSFGQRYTDDSLEWRSFP